MSSINPERIRSAKRLLFLLAWGLIGPVGSFAEVARSPRAVQAIHQRFPKPHSTLGSKFSVFRWFYLKIRYPSPVQRFTICFIICLSKMGYVEAAFLGRPTNSFRFPAASQNADSTKPGFDERPTASNWWLH